MAAENAWAIHAVSRTSVGTAATITPGTSLAVRTLERPTPTPVGTGLVDRVDASSPDAPGLRPVLGSRGWEVSFTTELYGFTDLDDYTTVGIGPLWAGAGVVTEGVSSLSWTQTRSMTRVGAGSASTGRVPFDLQIDHIGGNRYRLNNCLATAALSADSGGRIVVAWTVRGEYVQPVASTLNYGVVTYDAEPPIVSVGAGFADDMSDYSAVSRWSLEMGCELVDHPGIEQALGMGGPLVAWTGPTMLSFSADSADETAQTAWGDAYDVVAKALEIDFGRFRINLDPAFASAPPTIAGDSFGVYEHALIGEGNALTLTWSNP